MFEKLLTVIAVVVIILICTILLFRKSRVMQTRWEGAFRHIIAVMIGWISFSVLFFLSLVIDLFESDSFSLLGMLDALNNSLLILLFGVVVMFGSFVLLRKPQGKPSRN